MHIIELHIHKFLQEVNKGGYRIAPTLLEKFSETSKAHLKRQFERDPKNFTLRMSNIGHHTCQLECEQAGIPGEDTHNIIRNVYGDLCEDILMFLLMASGVPVVSFQEQVSLKLGKHTIDGTLDVVIDFGIKCDNCKNYLGKCPKCGSKLDPRVWDIKSVSEWVFKNKCKSYEDFIKGDSFGYQQQLFLYAAARDCKVGGWIIQNKSDGQIRVIEAPEEQQSIRRTVLREAEAKLDLFAGKKHNSMVHLDTVPSNKLGSPPKTGSIRATSYSTTANDVSTSSSTISTETARSKRTASSMEISPNTTPNKSIRLPTKRLDTIEELFRGKPTGNRILDIACTYCPYKWNCWSNLQLKPKAKSTAKDPPLVWYSEYTHE